MAIGYEDSAKMARFRQIWSHYCSAAIGNNRLNKNAAFTEYMQQNAAKTIWAKVIKYFWHDRYLTKRTNHHLKRKVG